MYLTGTCRGVGYRWKEGVGLLGLVLGPGGAGGGRIFTCDVAIYASERHFKCSSNINRVLI